MPSLAEIRQQYPQYDDLPDNKLADALHSKFYSDMPREEFNSKIGLKPEVSMSDRVQNAWDKATPGGPLWMLKTATQGITGAVQGSKDAMSTPITEEDAFRVNQGRDQGPARALDAIQFMTPTAPAGGLFARPLASTPSLMPATTADALVSKGGDLLDSAANIGVSIPRYLSTDKMPIQRAAAGLKNIPGAGDKIVKSAQAVNDELGLAAKTAAEAFGAGDASVAGGAAKDSLSSWIKTGSQKPVNEAYREVDGLINNEVISPLENTASEVAKIMAERANSRIPGKSGAVDSVLNAIQSEGLNYEGAKGLRSFLGEKTPQELIASGISPKEAKRLYGPLTKDLESIVEKAGGEQALNKWREANTLASVTAGQRKQLSKIIGAKGDATPEAVYSRLVTYAGSKSSGDINRLVMARKAMGEDAWNEVASATISRLGRDQQGNFSPDRFFTAYGNLTPAGKNTLFGGKSDQAKALDDINKIVVAVKDKIGKFSNPSGTAQNLMGAGVIGGVLADPITTLGSILGGRVLADVLSKPATAKATADFAKAFVAAQESSARSKRLMAELASSNLARAISADVQQVDVKTFLALLSRINGTVNAPAGNEAPDGRLRGDHKPNPHSVRQESSL